MYLQLSINLNLNYSECQLEAIIKTLGSSKKFGAEIRDLCRVTKQGDGRFF